MKREKITIADNGVVTVPDEVRMSIFEIADLFGIFCQTARKYVRAIEQSGIASGDYSLSCTAERQNVYPDYYELDMIIAVAFRVKSVRAEVFRQWILKKVVSQDITGMLTSSMQNAMLRDKK